MPYIQVSTSKTLTPKDKSDIFELVNNTITILPGKTPAVTMINITDGCSMQMGHDAVPCIFIEARLFKQSPEEAKSNFVAQLTKGLAEKLSTDPSKIYVNFLEFDAWGSNGAYKS